MCRLLNKNTCNCQCRLIPSLHWAFVQSSLQGNTSGHLCHGNQHLLSSSTVSIETIPAIFITFLFVSQCHYNKVSNLIYWRRIWHLIGCWLIFFLLQVIPLMTFLLTENKGNEMVMMMCVIPETQATVNQPCCLVTEPASRPATLELLRMCRAAVIQLLVQTPELSWRRPACAVSWGPQFLL